MRHWFNRYNFPYSNFHDLNLDWIIKEMTRLIEEWEQVKAEWEQMKIDWVEFQAEMQRLWNEYQELMNAAWEAFQNEMKDEWDTYKDDLNAQWIAYQNSLNAAWLNFQNAMSNWKDSVDQDIQDKFDEIDEKCDECQAAVQNALNELSQLMTDVQNQVTEYLANLPYQSIIHDTTVEWLDEHGVSVEGSEFIKPEDYYSTSWDAALTAAQNEAITENKILYLNKATNYDTTNTFTLKVSLLGNGATLSNVTINDNVKDIVIKDTNITSLSLSSSGTTTKSENILIENCEISDLVTLKYCKGIIFRDCTFNATANITSFFSEEGEMDVTFDNCTFKPLSSTLGLVNIGGAYETNLTLNNCVIEYVSGLAYPFPINTGVAPAATNSSFIIDNLVIRSSSGSAQGLNTSYIVNSYSSTPRINVYTNDPSFIRI